MNLEPIKRLIKDRLGLHFAEHTEDSLRRALEKRFAGTNTQSVTTYLQCLQADETEWQELTSLLTINETYFYREPQHLRLLTGELTAKLLARPDPGQRVRILSVGCSTGEEPYSIAIALREQYGESADRRFEITAGDVDRQALDKARSGVYGAYSFRALSAELAGRYFTPVDAQHRQIDPAIRRQVSLHHVNVLAGAYPQDWTGQDVVFFRNVSIYFDAATRRIIHQRLQSLLNPGGYLIVSATETLSNDFGLMTLQEQEGVFFFVNRPVSMHLPPWLKAVQAELSASNGDPIPPNPPLLKGGTERLPLPPLPRGAGELLNARFGTTSSPRMAEGLQTAENRYQKALTLAREQRFDEALHELAPLCAGDATQAHYWILQAYLLLERSNAAEATVAVERALALDAWSIDALLLRGRLARFQGQLEDAIRDFRQVVYVSADCWPAHYHLAELYRDRGQTGLALREYRIVWGQVADRDRALQTAGSLPLAISIQDLRVLCEMQLSRLSQTAD